MEFTTTEGTPLVLDWYHKDHLESSSKQLYHGYSAKNTISSIESELTIQLTNDTADSFHVYFCRVSFSNGTHLADSDKAYLFPQDLLSNQLKACEDEDVQSTNKDECIDPKLSVTSTEPTATTTTVATLPEMTDAESSDTPTEPIATTTTVATLPDTTETQSSDTPTESITTTIQTTLPDTTEDSVTTTESTTTTIQTTLPDTTIPPEDQTTTVATSDVSYTTTETSTTTFELSTTDGSSIDTSTTEQAIATQSTSSTDEIVASSTNPIPPVLKDSPSTAAQVGDGGSFDDEALIILTVGAAVFILIISCLVVFCLCLWSRQCRECGYNFCCTEEGCCCGCCCDI